MFDMGSIINADKGNSQRRMPTINKFSEHFYRIHRNIYRGLIRKQQSFLLLIHDHKNGEKGTAE